MPRVVFLSLLTIITVFFPSLIVAQPLWLDRNHANIIMLEILRPEFEGKDNITFTTATFFLSLRYSRPGQKWVVADIPFAHGDVDIEPGVLHSKYTIGNPYVGIEIPVRNSPVFAEFGLRVPLTLVKDDNHSVTLATDPVDRIEAFMPDMLPIMGMVNYRTQRPSGFITRLRGGPAFWVFAGNRGRTRTEWLLGLLVYSVQVGYEADHLSVGSGLSGRWLLTDKIVDGVILNEPHLYQLGFTTSVKFGLVRSGIQLRVPLNDNLRGIQDFVFGLHLGVPLK